MINCCRNEKLGESRKGKKTMTMKEIRQALGDAKDATLELRDNANHDEYAKYGELYEAILEAKKVADRNFGDDDAIPEECAMCEHRNGCAKRPGETSGGVCKGFEPVWVD